ncbi:MAG: glycoside hydrolase family 3 N-terminal domain-containing protein [bacterium]|nr:glycoside hydrolase family 3 N-terminal domain-containing protein [bacterium]
MVKKKITYITLVICLILLININPIASQTYLDSTALVDERVEDLLSRMTLDEKIGQMTQADRRYLDNESDITTFALGSLLSGGGSAPANNSPSSWADMYDNYQSKALATRLGIPLIYGIDAVHGHNNVKGAVIFPHNIGMGCTGNPELVQQAARITAKEVAGTGIDWTFAPCIAVPLDERWGRTYEGFAETAEITKLMSAASVKGLQGDSLWDRETILACAKHYVGDGGTTGGQDQGNTEIDEATLRAVHLPGYIAAIESGVGSIMASFNSWKGQKVHGSHYLLTTVLKEELGFEGFVVSDWAGIDQLPGDYTSDVEASINAGIDMVMVPDKYVTFISTLKLLVQQGKVSQERIDDAVRRILRIKFKLSLFERPYTDRFLTAQIGSDSHRAVGRECVHQSLVLLKKKDNILPLPNENFKIHVAGKNADDLGNQCGGWTISWQGSSGEITTGTTILQAIKGAAPNATISYSVDGVGASGSDIGVVVIGETPYAEGQGDRSDLNLAKNDITAVRNMKSAGIPVIVVLISGRPMILEPIWHFCDVFIAAWLPGTEGQGVADVLFGDYTPTGKLTHSWPRNMLQIPINIGDTDYDPLFEYGFGITSFANSPIGSSPIFYSAATTIEGSAIEVTFNKAMADPSAETNSFTVTLNSTQQIGIKEANLKPSDATTFVLTLNESIESGDKIALSYQPGNVRSADGGVLEAFIDQDVYNLLDDNSLIANIPGRIEAENYSKMHGVQTESTSDIGGGLNVGWIDDFDWMQYEVNVREQGTYQLAYRIASQSRSGEITLSSSLTSMIAVTDLPVTGGWQNWQTVTTDVNLQKGRQTLTLIASRGGFNINWFEFSLLTHVEAKEPPPASFQLNQNYPNPFNSSTTISYHLPVDGHVTLTVYNLHGQLVSRLINRREHAGNYQITWQSDAATGIYIYRIDFATSDRIFSEYRKMILIK